MKYDKIISVLDQVLLFLIKVIIFVTMSAVAALIMLAIVFGLTILLGG